MKLWKVVIPPSKRVKVRVFIGFVVGSEIGLERPGIMKSDS